jgi:hypothetical protein
MEFDLGLFLPAVRAPTLVVHRSGSALYDLAAVRAAAALIPGATWLELPGADALPYLGDAAALCDAIFEFLTGQPGPAEPDRSLATVLFTDIVGSTRITGYGQGGGGRVSSTFVRLGGMRVLVEAVAYPELRPEPIAGDDFVRFTQTAGGRPGIPAPRWVKEAPFVKTQGPAVWTTLALTLYTDGSVGQELAGASPFPRHWIYDADKKLAGKSALIDFKTWYRTATLARSPWRGHESAVVAAGAETPLERRLSLAMMRGGGAPPPARRVQAGHAILTEGEQSDELVLLLDGVAEVEAGGSVVAQLGPGAVLGERASLEGGRRTATVRAVTDCRIVTYEAAQLPERDLRDLAAGHHREDAP